MALQGAPVHGVRARPVEPHNRWWLSSCFASAAHDQPIAVLQTSYSFMNCFDFEVFHPLAFGETVVILASGDEMNPELVNQAAIAGRITHMTFVTSALMQCLQCRSQCLHMCPADWDVLPGLLA